ncbi:SPOR domain-containing protein [Halothiobacillus sp.]|uniref:SPOR domain-containing protein n=1 Tax=Halothiobacillus sp. TaxID=1891311 RepID=UPI002631E398|nr:SPOR domain-containing protein [Halothiobacillus sp.]
MNTAQQHALDQANLITQLIKYADRTILVESASEPERRAFVKLLDEQLPDHIDILGLRASPTTTPSAIITLVTEALQLSPGIESPQELATAAHEALTASERVLVVIENAHVWLNTPQWSEMVSYLRAAHDFAANQLLFLLTGDIGLTDQLRLEPELSEMQSDMHPCQLLGETPPSTEQTPAEAPTATTVQSLFVDDPEDGRGFNTSDHFKPTKRFSPALLIVAGISVAVVAFGGFALLTRSTDQPAKPQSLPLATETTATSTPTSLASNEMAQTDNPLPNDGPVSTPDLQASQATVAPATPPAAVAPPSAEIAPATRPTEATKPVEQSTAPIASEAPHLIPPKSQKLAGQPATTAAKPLEKAAPTPVKPPAPVAKPGEPKPAVKPVAVEGVDNAWYRARAPHRAVIQMGAFNDEKAALGFIKRHTSGAHITDWHLFSQTKNNQVLYTVTAGDFATPEAARKGLAQLPTVLQKLKPYPRTFASIREVLKP